MSEPSRFSGLGVCAGVAIGRVHLVDRRRVSVPRYHLQPGRAEAELERFERAIEASEAQLQDLRCKAAKTGLKEVEMLLEAHRMVLRDEAIRGATRERIERDHLNAEWALKQEVKQIRKMFDGLDEDYFKERRSDVDLVTDRVMRNLVGAETDFLDNLSEDAIVVAYDLSPADTVHLARYSAKGFVTETGGRTSHTAILAKAMNVPAVLGVHGIMERAGSGDAIIVDGGAGEVILAPDAQASARYTRRRRRREKEEAALLADRHLPAETQDGVRVHLLGNIEVADEIEHVRRQGGEGIGLYRTEFLVIERHAMPSAAEHASAYTRVVREVGAAPVTIRTVDIGGDKFVRTALRPSEAPTPSAAPVNPALGLRAIRISLREPEDFKAQVRGILQASAVGEVKLLLPFICGVEEVREAKALIDEAKQELARAGRAFDPMLRIGVMIETPAAVFLADALAREVDFFSLGTNDLIQYALAVDRGNDDVAYLYRPSSPAVLRMLRMVMDAARPAGVEVSVCGEMAGDPFHVPLLIGLGVRHLSMSAHSIPLVKRLVRRISAARCVELVERALALTTPDEVEEALAQALQDWEALTPVSLEDSDGGLSTTGEILRAELAITADVAAADLGE